MAQQRLTTAGVFYNFFLKRALRIYPAYYLVVAVAWLLTAGPALTYGSYLNFTSNLVIAHEQNWGRLAHL